MCDFPGGGGGIQRLTKTMFFLHLTKLTHSNSMKLVRDKLGGLCGVVHAFSDWQFNIHTSCGMLMSTLMIPSYVHTPTSQTQFSFQHLRMLSHPWTSMLITLVVTIIQV